jgi:hypothetical protein
MNRHERRRTEAQQRTYEERLRKDAESSEARTWATGLIEVVANEFACFTWIGTRQEAVNLQKQYLDMVNALVPISAHSYAKRAAGYLMAYGMPKAGDVDLRPSNHGNRWEQIDIDLYKCAILWLTLREHIPNTEQKLEDVFVGKALLVKFTGDKEQILADTARELGGKSLEGVKDVGHVVPGSVLPDNQFQMLVGVLDPSYRLNPRLAVSMRHTDLFALARAGLCRPTAASRMIQFTCRVFRSMPPRQTRCCACRRSWPMPPCRSRH